MFKSRYLSPPGLGAGVVAQLDGVPLLSAPRQLVAADTVKTTSPIPAHHPTHLNTLVARSAISRQWKHCSLQHSTYLPLSRLCVVSVCLLVVPEDEGLAGPGLALVPLQLQHAGPVVRKAVVHDADLHNIQL